MLISKRHFAGGPLHAARYATKYLTKVPAQGFPDWVLIQGRDMRIKRYGISSRFWPPPPPPKPPEVGQGATGDTHATDDNSAATERSPFRSYAERIGDCGTTFNALLVQEQEQVDPHTGEVYEQHQWIGQLAADKHLLHRIEDGNDPRRRRRDVTARSPCELLHIVSSLSTGPAYWVRGGDDDRPGKGSVKTNPFPS